MLFQADAAIIPLKDKSVHCIVTSPPYFKLRKYSGEQDRGLYPNLGHEPTVIEHINRMVKIFREIRRVLRDDGVVWLNYGPSYAGVSNARHKIGLEELSRFYRGGGHKLTDIDRQLSDELPAGNILFIPHMLALALQADGWIVRNDVVWCKPNPMPESPSGWRWERRRTKTGVDTKSETKIPQGWDRRQQPHTDLTGHYGDEKFLTTWEYHNDYELRKGSWRHTRSHEYFFQLSKNMRYWSNQEAIREIYTEPLNRWGGPQKSIDEHFKGDDENRMRGLHRDREVRPNIGRNPRSVLNVATKGYPGAHYAVFPPDLIAPLIMSSCPRRACPECGQGWAPVIDKEQYQKHETERSDIAKFFDGAHRSKHSPSININIRSYRPTCNCDNYKSQYQEMITNHPARSKNNKKRQQQDLQNCWLDRALSNRHIYQTIDTWLDSISGVVLDPFIGSGTTGLVAKELQRRWVGLDISFEYLEEQAKVRALRLTSRKFLNGLPLFDQTGGDNEIRTR